MGASGASEGVAGLRPRSQHNYLITNWQVDDGLPQNSITSICQSRDGYLWLGTFNGLVRFDGVGFTVYNSRTSPAMRSSRVVFAWEDREGDLWVGTEQGYLSRRTRRGFEEVWAPPPDRQVALISIAQDKGGAVWFTTVAGGLHRWSQNVVEEMPLPADARPQTAQSVMADADGQLWLLADSKLHILRDGTFSAPWADPETSQSVDFATPARQGGVWVIRAGQVRRFADGKWLEPFGRTTFGQTSPITTLYEDSRHRLWIGTVSTGVIRLSDEGGVPISQRDGLSHPSIRAIFEDSESNIWVGTDGGGLNRLTTRAVQVVGQLEGLSSELMLAVDEDAEGGLWVGTNGGGLNHIQKGVVKNAGLANGIASEHIWAILCDSKNRVWVGSWGGGVQILENGKFTTPPGLEHIPKVVFAIFEDREGIIWIGTQDGLARYDGKTATVLRKQDGLSHDDVRAILQTRDGALWVGTNGGGLNRIKDGQFTHWRASHGLSGDSVWCLHEDSEGDLWVGAFGAGISLIRGGRPLTFTEIRPLADAVVCKILEDSGGNLWISSYSGLFRVAAAALKTMDRANPGLLTLDHFGRQDGMPSRECTGGFNAAGVVTRDGRLIFPTVRGLAVVQPGEIPRNTQAPSMVVEDIRVDGESILQASGRFEITPLRDGNPQFVVSAKSERVEIQYTALSFRVPEKIRFRYRLRGLEEGWVEAGARRSTYYAFLPPGTFQFELQACNNDGLWNKGRVMFSLVVPPPFYATWWFAFLSTAGFAGCVYGVVRVVSINKLHRHMESLEQQHAVEKERSRIAKDIHDDLGASLTQITLLSELARTDLRQPALAEGHIRMISSTARELTRSMDEIVWAVNPANDTLEDLITYSSKYAQEYLNVARVRCRLNVPAQLPGIALSAEVRHNVFLALKEALNNIAKHSQATEAWLSLEASEAGFAITLDDNGVGPTHSEGAPPHPGGRLTPGSGLRNMEKRLLEIGGRFELETLRPKGTRTRFIVDLTRP